MRRTMKYLCYILMTGTLVVWAVYVIKLVFMFVKISRKHAVNDPALDDTLKMLGYTGCMIGLGMAFNLINILRPRSKDQK